MIVKKDSIFYSVNFNTQTYTPCVFPDGAEIIYDGSNQTYTFVRTINKICCFRVKSFAISCYYSDDEINWNAASFNGNSINDSTLSSMKYQYLKDDLIYFWDEFGTTNTYIYEIDLANNVFKQYNIKFSSSIRNGCINFDKNNNLIFTCWDLFKNNFHYYKLNKTSNTFEELTNTITYNSIINDKIGSRNVDYLIITDETNNKYYPTNSLGSIRDYILNIPVTLNESNYLNANLITINKPTNNATVNGTIGLIPHKINNQIKYSSIFECTGTDAFINSYKFGNVPLMPFPSETAFTQSDTSINAYIVNDKYIYNIYGRIFTDGPLLRYFDLSSINNEIQSLKIPSTVDAQQLYGHYFFLSRK